MLKPAATIEKLRTGASVTLAALGDSLTHGWMVSKGYLDFLGEMLREKYPRGTLRILGRGIPGDTAGGGLSRLQEDILDEGPDCLLVQFALNDAMSGCPVAAFRHNVQTIIDQTRQAGAADIVLVTSSHCQDRYASELVAPFYRELESLAQANGLPVAGAHGYWQEKINQGVDHQLLVQEDGVHPTVMGYRLMAEAIMALF